MIYVKTFRITAPFKNKGLHQYCVTFLIPFMNQNGFSVPIAKQTLIDQLVSYSDTFEKRTANFRFGRFTIADFGTKTSIGDFSGSFRFVVMSLDKDTVDQVAKGARRVCSEVISQYSTPEDQFEMGEIIEMRFPMEGIVTEKFNHQEKADKWVWLLDNFPYCDKIFEWLINNRHYPEVLVV